VADNKFFSKFPVITYANTQAVNITERVSMLNSVIANPFIYYPYDIASNERADQFANRYYGDPFCSWMIYISNQIVDPLREWYMTDSDFNDLITLKYGSLQYAMQKIAFYRNNWENASNISVSAYDALTPLLQGYWQAVFTGNKNTSYSRLQSDWVLNTNRIVAYSVANSNFSIDEVVQIQFDPYNIGQGQVLSRNTIDNVIYVEHLSGLYIETANTETSISNNSYIFGQQSQVNTAFSTDSNGNYIPSKLICENLAPEEEIYWTPVTYYDVENEKNEYNKTLRVLDKRYASTMASNLKTLLANT
jgi:hypothetical protein